MKPLTLKHILKRHKENPQDKKLHKVIEKSSADKEEFEKLEEKALKIDVFEDEIPTQNLLDSLKKSEADEKAGRVISFATNKDALDYLDAKIANDKENQ